MYASTHVMSANVLSGITASEPSPPFAMPMPPGKYKTWKSIQVLLVQGSGLDRSLAAGDRKAPAAHPVALRSCHAVARMIQTGPETPTVLVDPRTCR